MSETDDLIEATTALAARVKALEDQLEIMQLVAQYDGAGRAPGRRAGQASLTCARNTGWAVNEPYDPAVHSGDQRKQHGP